MGQLVFQATLGGQVNLVGPNTASTFNLSVPATTSTLATTSGTETLTNKTLTAPTLTSPNITTALTLTGASGTSGQVLTSAGTGAAPTWTTVVAGTGDVVGPASATANGIALFNSTTGKLIKDSAASDGLIYGLTVGRGAGAVSSNTALGASALSTNSSGTSNTAVGNNALSSNNTGGFNTAVGALTLQTNAGAGEYNNAFGWQALKANTTGNENQAFGISAMLANTTGSFNTAMGSNALRSNTTGNALTAVGYQAGYSQNASGDSYSTFVGYKAGTQITTGVANICIGWQTGQVITTGNRSVYIGFNNNASGTAASDEILISTTAGGTGKGSTTGFISPGGGGVYQGNNSTLWSVTSDQRLKKNIVDNNTGLSVINQIQVRNFEYRLPDEVDAELKPSDAIQKSGVQLGVIAQELNEVLPECIKIESTGVMSVNADNLTWYMINAIKELKAEIDSLKAQINGASA